MSEANEEDFVMSFQDSCDKPALLLIHGFPLSSQMWDPQIEDLGEFARVVAPDLRGFGHSSWVFIGRFIFDIDQVFHFYPPSI